MSRVRSLAPGTQGRAAKAPKKVDSPGEPRVKQGWGWMRAAYREVGNALTQIDLGTEKVLSWALVRVPVDEPLRPPPMLKAPVVMLPGLTMNADTYGRAAKHFASQKKNGPVVVWEAATQQFHLGKLSGRVLDREDFKNLKPKMFLMQYSDVNDGSTNTKDPTDLTKPTAKSAEAALLVQRVKEWTGAREIDLVGNSEGSTDILAYLASRRGGPRIGNVVFVDPASHGAFIGNLGGTIGGPVDVADAASELRIGSPLIAKLNKDLPRIMKQVHRSLTIIAVTGALTIGKRGVTNGDGDMPKNQAALPGAKVVFLRGLDLTAMAHLSAMEKSGVINALGKALANGNTSR